MHAPFKVESDQPVLAHLEVCRELKSNPATRHIYVILLTAMGQASDAESGYRAGADEYMTKPYAPRSLRKKLHELLDTHP
jgi:two-component system phosphate regulon response regulator PhoB